VAIQREQPAQAARIEAMQRMIEAKASAHKKDYPTAFAKMKEATALEEKDSAPSGPPDIIKPSHELYGELLLEAGRSREAIALFERSLERQPNRTRSVRGLEKARRESPANSGE
jgi:tetratricopeptide (TPR) repeat protein